MRININHKGTQRLSQRLTKDFLEDLKMHYKRFWKFIIKVTKFLLITGLISLVSCSGIPDEFAETKESPEIFPDITDVTVPVNIAPLNFRLTGSPDRIIGVIEGREGILKVKAREKVIIPLRKWHAMLDKNAGNELLVTVYSKEGDKWSKHLPFRIFIKETPVDPYLVYRLIAPGYETWSRMGIYQRNITNFDEDPVIDNRLLTGNCMNCHSFSRNNPEQMLFHLRGKIGGTILATNGSVVKLDTRRKETISNCVYPYWHPSGKYIAFSVNNISQVFHSVKEKRVEVMDSKSDLVVYDTEANKLITGNIVSSEESFETFPVFSADGNTLFFCSAKKGTIPVDYNKIRYSLCKISFDPSAGTFGNLVDTLISSCATGKSISFPRASHDGRHLMFTISDYGNFTIWHKEADLCLLDLTDGTYHPLDPVNSDETESYHSWSSGSQWFVFSSRRTDGLYTRPYISWLDENGEATKPFLLPQKDPDYYENSLFSFNVPEFVTGRIRYNGRNMLRAIGSEAKSVTFELKN